MIRIALAALASAAIATPVWAHDFWIEPAQFTLGAAGKVEVDVFVGHGEDKTGWPVAPHRIIGLRSLGPEGLVNHAQGPESLAQPLEVELASPGAHLLFIETTNSFSELEAEKFDAYAKEEGIRPIEVDRSLNRRTGPGRELYSRRGKSLLLVGCEAADRDVWQREVGLTLEVIPRVDPLSWEPGTDFPVEIRFHGAPVQGATLHVSNLEDDSISFTAQTGEDGRADLSGDLTEGRWLVHSVWSETAPSLLQGADYQTIFSSLTFDTQSACDGE